MKVFRRAVGIIVMPVMIAVSATLALLTVPFIALRALVRGAEREGDDPGDDATE